MDLQIIILSDVRQRKTNIIYHLHVESKMWCKQTYLKTETDTDIENKLMATKGKGREERDKLGVFD